MSVARPLAAPGYLRTNKHRRLAATMHRSTIPRQCGDAVLQMLVTGGTIDRQMLEGLYVLGKKFPSLASDILVNLRLQ